MPITESAKKALRQSKKRRLRNIKRNNAYRTAFKEMVKLAASGKFDDVKKLLPKTYKALDKAAKTGVIKKNKAARLKSKATRLIKKTA